MLKRLLAGCLILLLILPMTLSCSVANASETVLIPGNANAVLKIQVSEILANPTLQIAYNELAKANPSWPKNTADALSQFLQETGVDLSSISNLVLFADIESADQKQNPYFGIIASGNFDEKVLVEKIRQQTQQVPATSDYKGFKIYLGEMAQFEMLFLSQSQLVLGTPKAVRDVIDVSKRDQPALSGKVIETFNRFGAALIVGAFIPTESLKSQLVPQPSKQSLLPLKSLQDVDALGFAISQPSLSLRIRIDAHFSSATSGQNAKDALTGLISLAKVASQDENVKTILANIQVSATDSWVSIQDLISPIEITTLIGFLQEKK